MNKNEIGILATKMAINDFIKQVETETVKPIIIPEANKKNMYLKACWLLAQLQKAVNQARSIKYLPRDIESGVKKAESNIRFLKEYLPMLQKHYQKKK